MERAGSAAGDQAAASGGGPRGNPEPACAAPAGPACQPGTRAASGPALGALGPLREELARRIGASRSGKRGPEPKNAAAGRREARRLASGRSSQANLRWARPRGASQGAALPHQRLSALCSPHLLRSGKGQGVPAPFQRAGEAWLFGNRIRGPCTRLRIIMQQLQLDRRISCPAIHTKHSQHPLETTLRYCVNPVEGDAP